MQQHALPSEAEPAPSQQYPFDLLDLTLMLIAPAHAALMMLCILQYIARRSPIVITGLIDLAERVRGEPLALTSSPVTLQLLPGLAKLKPAPALPYPQAIGPLLDSPGLSILHIADIASSDNVLVVGPKGSGKTTLLRSLIALRAGTHCALDPHATPGKWPCSTVGGGLEYDHIATVLDSTYSTMRRRYKAMATGQLTEAQARAKRATIVADEYRSIAKELPKTREHKGASGILLDVLTQGRKAGIVALVAAHADTVVALGIEGEGDLRACFDTIVYLGALAVRKLPAAAAMARPAVAYDPERDVYTLLLLDTPAPHTKALASFSGAVDSNLLAGLLAEPGSQDAEPGSDTVRLSDTLEPGSLVQAEPGSGSELGNQVTRTELQQLARAIQLRAGGATETEAVCQGFSVSKGGSAAYKRARDLFKEAYQTSEVNDR